jgi:2-dehydropantoate 2-reductase
MPPRLHRIRRERTRATSRIAQVALRESRFWRSLVPARQPLERRGLHDRAEVLSSVLVTPADPSPSLRVAIVGAGALGGVLGGLLARAGHAVAFVARGDAVAVLRSQGVSVTAPAATGSFSTGPVEASEEPAELGVRDLIVVAVKAWQVEAQAPRLQPMVRPGTLVVPVQNGVEAPDQLAAVLGDEAVVGGLCHVLASRDGPGRVTYVGAAPRLTLGERAGGPSDRLERLAAVLRAAGIDASVSTDVRAALWAKLLFVEPFGSVGAVTRSAVDVVRAIPETRALLEQAMREVQAVAAGQGVHVPDDTVVQSLARIDSLPPGATASMHRDLVDGRSSELDQQTGAVVRLGRSAGVGCPVHDFLHASLLPQERRSRSKPALPG